MYAQLLLICSLLFPIIIFGQTEDSLKILQELEQFEFTNAADVPAYRNLYKKNRRVFTPDQKLVITQKGINAAKQFQNDSIFLHFSFDKVEVLFAELKEYEQARKLLQEIKPQVDTYELDEIRAFYYIILGIIHNREGNSSKALDSYLKSYNFYKNSNAPNRLVTSLYNISAIYSEIGDFKTAIKYAYEMLEISRNIEGIYGLQMEMNAHYRLSTTFDRKENQDSAIHHGIKAIDIAEKIDTIKNPLMMTACCRVYLGGIKLLSQNKDFEKVDVLLAKVQPCKGKVEPIYSWAMTEYYIEKEQYETAGEILKKLPEKENSPNYNFYTSDLKSSYYKAIGNFEKALIEKDKAFDIREKITDQARLQYAAFAEERYESAQREEAIKNLQKSEAFEQQKFHLLSVVTFLLIALHLLGILGYRKIKRQATELKNNYEQRSKLFANIAHELRTPLTLISGPIHQIIQHPKLEEEDKNLLNLAKKSSEDLVSISQQILDLTKSEHDNIQPNLVQFNWSDFLHQYLPKYEMQAANRGLGFEKNIPTEDCWVQTDMEKLKVILNNLFQNALKFSKESGKIKFESILQKEQISFSIEDTGIGIDEKEQTHIFKRYYQSNHNLGGFGIGLAACREYVAILGGSIRLKSHLGKGTTVFVSFPKKIESNQAIKTLKSPPISIGEVSHETLTIRDPDATKLLIIEDHEGLRSFLASGLHRDYDIHFANNGKEGLQKLDSLQPDLVITDWMMPIMNGLQFIEQLRQQERWYHLPVLMLTARSFPVDKLKALQKGVNDYLLKPFEMDVLKVHIENLLNLSVHRKASIDVSILLDSVSNNAKPLDFASQSKKDHEWILAVEATIYQHIQDFDLNIGLLAEKANLSKSHFSRKVKIITGMPPVQFIKEVRFWEARKLLEEKQETSVKAVAYSVGLKSVKTFSRNFKQRFGVYPKDLLD